MPQRLLFPTHAHACGGPSNDASRHVVIPNPDTKTSAAHLTGGSGLRFGGGGGGAGGVGSGSGAGAGFLGAISTPGSLSCKDAETPCEMPAGGHRCPAAFQEEGRVRVKVRFQAEACRSGLFGGDGGGCRAASSRCSRIQSSALACHLQTRTHLDEMATHAATLGRGRGGTEGAHTRHSRQIAAWMAATKNAVPPPDPPRRTGG